MKTKERAQKDRFQTYYLVKCPYCGTELVVSSQDLEKERFNPTVKEHEKTGYQLTSSDPDKDVYHMKCCQCGHLWNEPTKDMYDKRCNQYGVDSIVFDLGEEMTKRAEQFMKKHTHKEELMKEKGSLFFSSLGQQFTYTITPGGLGDMISIKCNYCNETEDLTNIEEW